MRKNTNPSPTRCAPINLLLAVWCAVVPVVSPLQAASISQPTRNARQLTKRLAFPSEPIRGNDRGGTQFKTPPLRFELNTGQTYPEARLIARDRDGVVFLTATEAVLRVSRRSNPVESKPGLRRVAYTQGLGAFESAVVRIRPTGGNPSPRITAIDLLPGRTNYFIGNDPKEWRTDVRGYAKVRYEGVYPGIDLVYYGNEEGRLEYDFIVAPGADPRVIAMSIEGADSIETDESGDLIISAAIGNIRQHAPRIYQEVGGARREIVGGYAIRSEREVAFQVGDYDAGKVLVIDPQIVYATYLGGTQQFGEEPGNGIAVDSTGADISPGDRRLRLSN